MNIRKKALDLQISFVVVIILSVIGLFFGLLILGRIKSVKDQTQLIITKDIDVNLKNILKDTKKVAILPDTLTKNNNQFFLGIKNVFNETKEFIVNFSIYQKNEGINFIYPNVSQFNLSKNETKIMSFLLNKKYLIDNFKDDFPLIIVVKVYYKNIDWILYQDTVIKVEG
ncbi:MAG: hypothetical protein QXR30_00070 [Candidatus Woesearchaeota archaeon]